MLAHDVAGGVSSVVCSVKRVTTRSQNAGTDSARQNGCVLHTSALCSLLLTVTPVRLAPQGDELQILALECPLET